MFCPEVSSNSQFFSVLSTPSRTLLPDPSVVDSWSSRQFTHGWALIVNVYWIRCPLMSLWINCYLLQKEASLTKGGSNTEVYFHKVSSLSSTSCPLPAKNKPIIKIWPCVSELIYFAQLMRSYIYVGVTREGKNCEQKAEKWEGRHHPEFSSCASMELALWESWARLSMVCLSCQNNIPHTRWVKQGKQTFLELWKLQVFFFFFAI